MAFYDGLLTAIGIPTQKELNQKAAEEFREIREARDPASHFATYRASTVASMDNRSIRRAMPMLPSEAIPPYDKKNRSSDQRTAFVAKGLLNYANHFLDNGSDGSMPPPLGRAVRESALRDISPMHLDRDLADTKLIDVMANKAKKIGIATSAYLAAGKPHEEAIDKIADNVVRDQYRMMTLRHNTDKVIPGLPQDPDSRATDAWDRSKVTSDQASEWARRALAVEVALARGGVLPPDRIVENATHDRYHAAILSDTLNHPDASKTVQIHPNFQRGRNTKPEGYAAVVDQHISSSRNPETKYLEQREFREKKTEDREITKIALAPAKTAAIGAMRESLIGNQR